MAESWAEMAEKSVFSVDERYGDLIVRNAVIVWTNFAGEQTRFTNGKRTFNLVLSQDMASALEEEGWNVKVRPPKEEGDLPLCFTEVNVNFDSQYPPAIKLCTEWNGVKNITDLGPDDVGRLDHVSLTNIKLAIHPYEHGRHVSSGSTVKGYLKAMRATEVPGAGNFFDDDDDEEAPFN